ncbi:MAG: DUF4065 domain-containing protein [Deltaproteobacteria bacterium]|nr:DUF4065 domain-containing protein [Deltaproteobacteria bacterium]
MNKTSLRESLKNLINAIIYFVDQREGYVTKTKLLKYLYLIDVELYRRNRKTLTGFKWIFYEYGPWTREFEELYSEMVDRGDLKVRSGSRDDLATQFLSPIEAVPIESIFPKIEEKCTVEQILDRWALEPLNVMLNYVYFDTEPMENATRYKELDFSNIATVPEPTKMRLPESGTDPKKIALLKEKIRGEVLHKRREAQMPFTQPRYDDTFFEALERLNNDDTY